MMVWILIVLVSHYSLKKYQPRYIICPSVCGLLLLLCFHLSCYYISLPLNSLAVLNNTVVRTPYRDSEKCLADLLPYPGSEDSKRWQPSGSSSSSLLTADVDKFRNPHFFQQTDLIRRGPSVCNQSQARISSLRAVDNGP